MIKIAFPFVGDSVGGSQISALQLINALNAETYEAVVVLHQTGPLSDYFDKLNFKYSLLPLSRYVGGGSTILDHVLGAAHTTPRLWRFLATSNIDLVHTQDGRMNQTWALPVKFSKALHIWHQRSVYAISRLTRASISLADAIICNSNFVRDSLPPPVRARADVVINPFVHSPGQLDRPACRERCLNEIGAPEKTQIIGFVGNLSEQKRPKVFIEAAAVLNRKTPGAYRFVFFGRDRGGLRDAIDRQIKDLELEGIVHFMGFRDNIQECIAGCDLLLAPQVDEAYGRTLVEAMLVGTPVIASNSGGHREIIRSPQTGILVGVDDAGAMAAAVSTCLAAPERLERMTETAREAARAAHSGTAHAAEVAAIYERCLKRR